MASLGDWNDGMLGYWIFEKEPLFHYSIIPLLHYSNIPFLRGYYLHCPITM